MSTIIEIYNAMPWWVVVSCIGLLALAISIPFTKSEREQ